MTGTASAVVEALRAEAAKTADLLDTVANGDWDLPTRCPPLSLFELAAHAWRGAARIFEMVEAGPLRDEAGVDAAENFRYDPEEIAPQVVARAQATAADLDPKTFADHWRRGWREALDLAAGLIADGDAVYAAVFGPMHMSEYLKTRVLEVTVHAMDLRDALALPPDPAPGALEITCGILEALLGGTRPAGMDGVRFALTGTGRARLNEAERAALGPAAGHFPLLR